jgi:hypothetical protein
MEHSERQQGSAGDGDVSATPNPEAGETSRGTSSAHEAGETSDAAGSAHEALRRLEDRLDRASEAAERLLAQAAAETLARVAGATRTEDDPGPDRRAESRIEDGPGADGEQESGAASEPPPSGWQVPRSDAGPDSRRDGDVELFAGIVQSLRELIPPDLQRRLAEALRELLLALRALIDWYLERLERRRKAPVEVEDIPIL